LGAIYNLGILTVANSTFSGNSASNGAAILSFGTLTVTDSTFSGNSALFGGAIGIGRSPFGDSLTVINSTFSGNSASGRGGAIYFNSRGTLTITNSTFSGNSAPDGGGITNTVGNATLRGAILAGPSSGGNCNGRMTDGGYNISDDDSCGFSATGSHNNTDPLLSPDGLADNGGPTDTIALQPASPAIDKIPPADCPATDQRGYSRPAPGQADCDIGAYELDAGPGPPVDCSTAQASKANLVALALPFVLVPEQVTGVSDSSGPYSVSITSITQDKPISRSRLLCPDGVGVGTNTASVRPIKQGSGGLIYTLGFTATDTGGAGSCTGAVEVCVQDLFHQGKCVDTGESYDATKCPP
jgi:predicted outer membrane repeat protein